jgi:hypothetical protein
MSVLVAFPTSNDATFEIKHEINHITRFPVNNAQILNIQQDTTPVIVLLIR